MSGEKRPDQICREQNLAPSVGLRWRNEDEQHGEVAFLFPATSKPLSAEAKIAELEHFGRQLANEDEQHGEVAFLFPATSKPLSAEAKHD